MKNICYTKKENISEAAIERRSSENVYCKNLFLIVVALSVKKLNFSKVQGFQPQMHNSSFVEHFLVAASGILKMQGSSCIYW